MTRIFLALSILAAATALAPARAQQDPLSDKSAVQLLHVQGRVHMLVGAGANITIQLGDNAVVLVDTGLPQMSPQVLAAIRSLSQKPIEFIINTSADADHTGGNHNLSQAGHFISGMAGETPGRLDRLPDRRSRPHDRRQRQQGHCLSAGTLAHRHL